MTLGTEFCINKALEIIRNRYPEADHPDVTLKRITPWLVSSLVVPERYKVSINKCFSGLVFVRNFNIH